MPFGRRIAQGVVVELAEAPQVEVTRDILQPIEPSPLIRPLDLVLAKWMARYYLCSIFTAISPLLPPGFESQVRSKVSPGPRFLALNSEADCLDGAKDGGLPTLRADSVKALKSLADSSSLRERDFLKLLGLSLIHISEPTRPY